MTRSLTLAVALALATTTAIARPAPASAGRGHAAQPQPARTRFHFDDIPVRSALQLLAEEGGVNLVVSDSVKGNVSLHLDNVTWEQALAIVARLKGLEVRLLGNGRVVAVR